VPFEAPTIEEVISAHVNTPLTPPNHVQPDISAATSDALMMAMAKEPLDRFRSYDEFIMAFTAARSQLLVQQLQMQQDPEEPGPGQEGQKGWWRR
jgi:hypothetical protein